MRGTIFQKVYVVNTFLFSKLWYVAHVVKLDSKILNGILKKALNFVYAGENERPVNQLNFRNKAQGGLGLINPIVKAKTFLVKNMIKDFINYDTDINDDYVINGLYGYTEIFKDMYLQDMADTPVKEIYEYLMIDILEKNGSLIPSRNEKKTNNVKWNISWKNLKMLKGVNAEEKEFIWKVIQDMVPVGRRIHRCNVEKRCLKRLTSGQECQEIPDLSHALFECESMEYIWRYEKYM